MFCIFAPEMSGYGKTEAIDRVFCDYKLIALHTHLEDYQLAYFLNKTLHLQLAKTKGKACLTMPSGGQFSYYTWEDTSTDITWHCIANKLQDTQAPTAVVTLLKNCHRCNILVENEKEGGLLFEDRY